MPFARCARAVACTAAASFVLAGSALASDTAISVSPRVVVSSPEPSPAEFPGVSKVRTGEPLPRGWVVVARDVRITRGTEAAFAALRMTCPAGRTWRSGTSSGAVGAGVLDRNARATKRTVLMLASYQHSDLRDGETATGTVFALCR